MLAAGARFGPYEIVTLIGRGGMGEVYRARDLRLGRDVAIKIISSDRSADPTAVIRFEHEARAVAALSHPHIVTLHDVGAVHGVVYAVMELLDGESLDCRIAREGVSWRRALEIAAAVADGLSAAHAKGIVHRDLKPANLFLTRDGQIKILDFGLAGPIAIGAPSVTIPSRAAATTDTADGPGTVGYAAPEQITGEGSDARSDIFSVGCILYEMLTRRRAFPGTTSAEALAAILRTQPADLAPGGTGLPASVAAIVRRCLEKDREQRFQSARDLAFALRAGDDHRIARPRRTRKVLAGIAVSTLALTAVVAPGRFFRTGASGVRSVAVLPLVDRSQDAAHQQFADAVTDDLIASLARIAQLRVTSRTSAMSYKGTKKGLSQIARELGVDAVVAGSVARDGTRVKISAELIDPATDSQIWSDAYQRDIRDIVATENELAAAVVRKLVDRLNPDDRGRLDAGRRVEPAAYDDYVKGRYYYNKRSALDLERAVEHFRLAIDADPTYAAAYAGLADAYSIIGYQNYLAPRETFPKADAAARRALELDGNLADPHASLGYIHLYYDWDFAAAEAEFQRAIALSPNSVPARHFYSILLTALLRPAEARTQIERAHTLDPLSPLVASDMGFELYYARQYDEAARALRDAISMSPAAAAPHFWLGRVFQAQNKYREAFAEFQAGGHDLAAWPPSVSGVGHLHGLLGERAAAFDVLSALDSMAQHKYVSAYARALVYLGLGDRTQAFAWLNRAYEERSNWLVWLLKDPRWDPVRSDPRFAAILARVGFPKDARARAAASSPSR